MKTTISYFFFSACFLLKISNLINRKNLSPVRILSFSFILFLSATISALTIPSHVPTNGLIACYPFDGNTNDVSGNALNPSSMTDITWVADKYSAANSAVSFNGTTSKITIPSSASSPWQFAQPNYSIVFYIKPNGF